MLVIGNRLYSVLGRILQVAVGNGIKNAPVIEFTTRADLLHPFLILLTGCHRFHFLTTVPICKTVYILSFRRDRGAAGPTRVSLNKTMRFSIIEGTKNGLENNRSFLAGFGGPGVPLSTLYYYIKIGLLKAGILVRSTSNFFSYS